MYVESGEGAGRMLTAHGSDSHGFRIGGHRSVCSTEQRALAWPTHSRPPRGANAAASVAQLGFLKHLVPGISMSQSSFLGQELPKGTKLNSGPDDRFLYDSPLKAPI